MNPSTEFAEQLGHYKSIIDNDIEQYCDSIQDKTAEVYGENSAIVSEAFTEILMRDSKRIRGALTIVGYEMCGGTDIELITPVARVVEMMQAYLLIIDDVQDRSDVRRGGPSAHKFIQTEHEKRGWSGDAEHTGVSLALNAGLLGAHNAQVILANLDADPEFKIKALSILNHTMMVTAHGQTNDIINEVSNTTTLEDINRVMQWKTAHYSFLNPLHMGMVFAGAGCEDTNAITDYALNVGKAYQYTDDLLVVEDATAVGKDLSGDIREGKKTLLTHHALTHADKGDSEFLLSCLGNPDLSAEDFTRCQEIFKKSGAIDYARSSTESLIQAARTTLSAHAERWNPGSVKFLDGLAQYILTRAR